MARCLGLNKEGKPCRYDLPEGVEYCGAHDPSLTKEDRRVAASRAGKASGAARRQKSIYEIPLNLANRSGIQAAIQAVTALEFAGRLPGTRTRNLLRALALASRNFNPPASRYSNPPDHGEHFWSWIDAIDNNVGDLLVEADVQDTRRALDQSHIRRYGRIMPTDEFAKILSKLPRRPVDPAPAHPLNAEQLQPPNELP